MKRTMTPAGLPHVFAKSDRNIAKNDNIEASSKSIISLNNKSRLHTKRKQRLYFASENNTQENKGLICTLEKISGKIWKTHRLNCWNFCKARAEKSIVYLFNSCVVLAVDKKDTDARRATAWRWIDRNYEATKRTKTSLFLKFHRKTIYRNTRAQGIINTKGTFILG